MRPENSKPFPFGWIANCPGLAERGKWMPFAEPLNMGCAASRKAWASVRKEPLLSPAQLLAVSAIAAAHQRRAERRALIGVQSTR